MNKNRQIKELKVKEIAEKMGNAKSLVLVDYQGISVEEDTELRKNLREANVEYRVYKNSLVKRATKEVGIDGLDDYLAGPVSIAFGYEDETTAARLLAEFAKKAKKLEIKGGYIEGEVYDSELMDKLSKIPSKEELISKFLGSITSPLSKLVYVLDSVAKSQEEAKEA